MSKVLPILFALLMQQKAAVPQKEAPPPKPTVLKFDDPDWVSYTKLTPEDTVVEATKRQPPKNLHVVRKNFIREVYKSVESF